MSLSPASTPSRSPKPGPAVEKMPGHWLLARMGKRVLRPGGIELTRQLLAALSIGEHDEVVEFAPGLGVTARMTVARKPCSYTAVERDPAAASVVAGFLSGPGQRCVTGTAEQTGLPAHSATVVYGEAMLSMQTTAAKARIAAEAARLLIPGGRYGIHELCLVPDDLDPTVRDAIKRELSQEVHVGVRPLTAGEWRQFLRSAGLNVVFVRTAPMHLLEPRRLIRDEGLWSAIRFVWNVARDRTARHRVRGMRRVFRKYRGHLAALVLVAVKQSDAPE